MIRYPVLVCESFGARRTRRIAMNNTAAFRLRAQVITAFQVKSPAGKTYKVTERRRKKVCHTFRCGTPIKVRITEYWWKGEITKL